MDKKENKNERNLILMLAIVVILLICIAIIVIKMNKRDNSNKNVIDESKLQTTTEEGRTIVLNRMEKKLQEKGLIIEDKYEKVGSYYTQSTGIVYTVSLKSNTTESFNIEVFVLSSEEKASFIEEGEITIGYGEESKKAIIYGTTLVVECENEEINNIVKSILEWKD